jgi:hypothetical protein
MCQSQKASVYSPFHWVLENIFKCVNRLEHQFLRFIWICSLFFVSDPNSKCVGIEIHSEYVLLLLKIKKLTYRLGSFKI